MGRIAILATDIFLCLFAVFAVLREIVPHYEFLPPNYPFVEISWHGSAPERCLVHAETDSALGVTVLTEPSTRPVAQYNHDTERCILRRKIDGRELATDLKVVLILPLLSTADCDEAEVKVLDKIERLANCTATAAQFTVVFAS